MFQKNIEKVWDIEKICKIAKIRKNEVKNDRVPTFFYVKVFRWTGLKSTLQLPMYEFHCYEVFRNYFNRFQQ